MKAKELIEMGELEMDRGRFAEAEVAFETALGRSGSDALAARSLLAELLWRQGRQDEIPPLIEANLDAVSRASGSRSRAALELLKAHITLDLLPRPVERIQAILGLASKCAPDDDRVWLARANLAIETGKIGEAEQWLDACLRRRPDDAAVWRSRLAWAMAASRTDEAARALSHLPADLFSPGRVQAIRAWFAARRGGIAQERQALQALVDLEPGNFAALARLAELASGDAPTGLSSRLRARKAELDQALVRYKNLVTGGDLLQNAVEMAHLAEVLGRRFEARGFLTLALRRDPQRPDAREALARLRREATPKPAPGQTLADLLAADLIPGDPAGAGPPRPTPAGTPGPRPRFRDDAATACLRFVHRSGQSEARQLPEAMSGGVALLDYDGDGRLDVFVVQGGRFPPDPSERGSGDHLYRNRGDGTFEDVTEAARLRGMAGGYGHGVAVGDYDNDGHPDLFLTRWRAYALYRNRGDGTFEDATARAGLGGDRDWPTSAAFADLDNDGDLDLYVCHYLEWNADHPRLCPGQSPGTYTACDPHRFRALPDHVFRNESGRFLDVTPEAGITDPDGRGMGAVAADFDEDGKVDLFVTNDGTANYLFRNLGGFRFEEVGQAAGVSSNADGGYQAGMGAACGDLDGDGRLDLAVTNFFGESTTLYQNFGGVLFADRSVALGLAAPTRFLLGFGVAFLDADNDGRLDLMAANGHVNDYRPHIPYAMPAQLLLGVGEGRVVDASGGAGPPFQAAYLGRGLAVGDLDDDGRVDALLVSQNGPMVYLHNRTEGGHSITLRLEGSRSNRDAVGASVKLDCDGRRLVAQRLGGGSYQSASDPRLHFGLGRSDRIERLEVCWPSGRHDRFENLPADATYHIREGRREIRARPHPGR